MRDQEIYREIGKLLWSIFPSDASSAHFIGTVYDDNSQVGPEWFDVNGNRLGPKDFNNYPYDICNLVTGLIRELQTVPPFDKEPFTHFKYMLTDKGKMNVEFAYIPEWDSWPSVFMKGLSQFSKEEAMEFGSRRYEAWKQAAERFKKEPY